MIQFKNQPALKTTFIGFGQGGGRIVDVFASFKDAQKTPYYSTFALNSTRKDFGVLKHIPKNNLVSLEMNGFGKDPLEAMEVMSVQRNCMDKIHEFVDSFYDSEQDLFIFCTTLGGGTGTSTIVKTIEVYVEKYITPQIQKALEIVLREKKSSMEVYERLSQEQKNLVLVEALEKANRYGKLKKIGIIAALPPRNDGPKTLSQVNQFADYLWKLAKNPLKGIAFITFPDNQKFFDDWTSNQAKLEEKNFRDYANNQIAEVFHELNMSTNNEGTDVTFDAKDFKKILVDGNGYLNINRISKDAKSITSNKDMVELLKQTFDGSLLHEPIRLQSNDEETNEIIHQKVFDIGLLTITNKDSDDIGSAFLDEVKDQVANEIFVNGSIFTGSVQLQRTNYQTIAYAFYKTHGLPERLSTGLVKELEQYREKKITRTYKSDSVKKAEKVALERDMSVFEDVSMGDGFSANLDFLKVNTENKEKDTTEEVQEKASDSLGSDSSLDWLKDW